MANVKVSGFTLSDDKVREWISRPNGGASTLLDNKGIAIKAKAIELASVGYPNVQTGRYRSSFVHEVKPTSGSNQYGSNLMLRVGNTANYAVHLEYGTRNFKVAPNGYRVLTNAMRQSETIFPR